MKFKQLRLKNFNEIQKEEFVIDFPTGGIADLDLILPEDAFTQFYTIETISEFFRFIPNYLLTHDKSLLTSIMYDKLEPIEVTMILVEEGNEICYNIMFFPDEVLTESLVINNRMAIYSSIEEINIGAGFIGDAEDEENLLKYYEYIKSDNFKRSLIFSYSDPIFMNLRDFFLYKLRIIEFNQGCYLSGEQQKFNLKHNYSEKVQTIVRKALPELGFGIQEITEDWIIKTEIDSEGKLGIDSYGSGFKILLSLLPELVNCCINKDNCLVICNTFSGLHYLLKKKLISLIEDNIGNSQIICSLNN